MIDGLYSLFRRRGCSRRLRMTRNVVIIIIIIIIVVKYIYIGPVVWSAGPLTSLRSRKMSLNT